jgi:hypothetical protein
MDHMSARRQRLWEAMESCRGGNDDLSDPQFADLVARLAEDPDLRVQFERIQRADAAIKIAFARIAVPSGLADQVARHLTQAATVPAPVTPAEPGVSVENLVEAAVAAPDSPAPLPMRTARFSRRRLLIGFAALAAASVLLTAVWVQTRHSRHDSPSSVLEEAMNFFDEDNSLGGRLITETAPPTEFPLSRDIARLQGIRWRSVDKLLADRGVAYDLPTQGGRATLYVLQRTIAGLPAFPPGSPSLSTGGKSAAAWQVGSTLYVLVVEGEAWRYSDCLDHSHGPLT